LYILPGYLKAIEIQVKMVLVWKVSAIVLLCNLSKFENSFAVIIATWFYVASY